MRIRIVGQGARDDKGYWVGDNTDQGQVTDMNVLMMKTDAGREERVAKAL